MYECHCVNSLQYIFPLTICLLHITMREIFWKYEFGWMSSIFLLKWENSTGNMFEATSKDMDILWLVAIMNLYNKYSSDSDHLVNVFYARKSQESGGTWMGFTGGWYA